MLKASAQEERGWVLGLVGAGSFLAFAAVVLVLLVAAQRGEPPSAGTVLHAVALASLYAVPGVLSFLGLRSRPGLLAAAAVMGYALLPTSFSVTPLLVIPSTLVLAAFQRRRPGFRPRIPTMVAALAAVTVAAACFGLLVLDPGTRCWTYEQSPGGPRIFHTAPVTDGGLSAGPVPPGPQGGTSGGGCDQDLFSPVRSLAALGVLGTFLGAACWAGARRAPTAPGPPEPGRAGRAAAGPRRWCRPPR